MRARVLLLGILALIVFATYSFIPRAPSPAQVVAHAGFDLPRPEGNIKFAEDTYPVPLSPWRQRQQDAWSDLMTGTHVDLIVVPFETMDEGVDQSTRSLMAATLAHEIASSTQFSVLDPYLAGRSLGDPTRRFETTAVEALARHLSASRIIRGFVGYDLRDRVTITVTLDTIPFDPAQRVGTTLARLTFSAATTPLDLFRNHIHDVLDALGIDAKRVPQRDYAGNDQPPKDPFALTTPFEGGPAEAALRFQLLGALTPAASERVRDRLFERSLLAVEQMRPSAPEYRQLKARALFSLHQRPEALAVLEEQRTKPEEQELYAALNGNLPDVEQFTAQLQGVQRLFGLLDANYLQFTYGVWNRERSVADAASFAQTDEVVAHLIQMRFLDWDAWRDTRNDPITLALERDFPVAGPDLTDNARSAAVLGQASPPPQLAVVDHWQRFVKQNPKLFCCAPPSSFVPSPVDYLEVLQAHGEANLLRDFDRILDGQGLPQPALDFIDSIASVYAGNDALEMRRGRALAALADHSTGALHDGQTRAAAAAAYQALFWEQGQTRVVVDARRVLLHVKDLQHGMDPDLFRTDIPPRPFITGAGIEDLSATDARVRRLAYATTEFEAAESLIKALDEAGKPIDPLLTDLTGRFGGDPKRDEFLGERSLMAGRTAEAREHYAAAVASQPDYWNARLMLGYLMICDDDYDGAARLFDSYRGAIAKGGTPLDVTNNAFQAGNLFYWRGRFDQAKHFFDISANTQTGAQAEMSSAIRLALMQGDYLTAALGSREVANRYHFTYAYRDYLALLHMLGHSEEAWDGFAALVRQYPDSPHVWESASVGQRLKQMSDHDIVAWAQLPEQQSETVEAYRLATIHLVRSATMDRMPSTEMIDAIKTSDSTVVSRPDGLTIRASLENPAVGIVAGPTGQRRRSVEATLTGPTTPVPSELTLFVEGYRSLKSGDAAQAARSLSHAANTYDLEQEQQSFIQPYYAFAMAASGQGDAARKILDAYGPSSPNTSFDHKLAEGVLLAFAGSHDSAEKTLAAALAARVFTEARPVHVEYEFAEILEWLSTATGEPRYRRHALEWAKANQQVSPWFAWPYALEAKLTENVSDRRRAMQRAAFLDPQSAWLSSVPGAEAAIAAARAESNPFATAANEAAQKSKRTPS